jgi:hypothetical protein
MSKIIFKKIKKHYWHAFWHEKLFEKYPQPHCQTHLKNTWKQIKAMNHDGVGKVDGIKG